MKQLLTGVIAALIAGPAFADGPSRLPDGVVTKGMHDIAEAWLTLPTDRYGHGILGDKIEAGGLVVKLPIGELVETVLPEEYVFEDRRVRLADLDLDGHDEIIVVLSSLKQGAALAVYGLRGGEVTKIAQTPHIGRANRWLNPAEIADLDGDGKPEIIAVWTPHLGGDVQAWDLTKGRMTMLASIAGYSNHIIGSRVQDMTGVVTLTDGRKALAIPALTYDEIAFLTLRVGRFSEAARVPAGGRITSAVTLSKNGRQLEFATGQARRSVLIP